MHTYLALLGINPTISIAEFAAVLPDFQPISTTPEMVVFTSAVEIDQAFLSRLGGTILIARQVSAPHAVTMNDLPTVMATELKNIKGKATFALRFFGVPPRAAQELYRECKSHLKKQSTPSRYVGNERDPAKPIQLHDEGLIDGSSGCELVILMRRDGAKQPTLWVGKTVAAQDVKAYTFRDMEKPVRDTTVGLLPPKLAQILLNFGAFLSGGSEKNLLVFDPFCGTGVIPLETMLRGWGVLASDVSQKAVSGTEKNIEWLRKHFKLAKKDIPSTVWKQDATKAFALKERPDVIVTEGSLGPPLKNRPLIKEVDGYCKIAEDLTARFLKNCAESLPGVPIVMTVPMWYAQKKQIQLQKLWDVCTALNYRPVLPPHTNPSDMGRFSLLYRRNDQFVGREIILLKPVSK